MKAKEFIIEYKKDRKAPKFNIKPRTGHAPTQTGAGHHRDKKKEQKQGYEKHKGQGVAEGKDHPYDRGMEDARAGKEYNDSAYSNYQDKEEYRRGRIVYKQQKKKGVAEGEAQEYTVRVVDEEGSGYTVKVTAPSEQGALHKAIVRVRNSGARPEHARIIRQDVAEADETSWTANSAQFRKEEDLSWTVEVTLEPRADINQGRGRQVKTMTVTAPSRDAAKKKLADYYRKNGWAVTGIKFAGDLDEAEDDKVRRVNNAEYYHLKLLAKEAGITLTGMGADKVTGDLHWQGDTRDGRRVSGTVKKVIDDNGEYIQGVAEGESALEKFRKAAAEREKKHAAAEKEMKARHASGKEDMKGAIDRLAKHLDNK